MTLPPGQRLADGFPRFGAHLAHPAPAIPVRPEIEVTGTVAEPFIVPLTRLAALPRCEVTADFHCVAGWSVTGLRWEGVAFADFYRTVVEPAVRPGVTITHVVFGALDRYRSLATLDDALADDVLIAENLGGSPLDPDHGAPARLVSPSQYGFVSVKHLCRIQVHTSEPTGVYRGAAMRVLQPHTRARVWREERHRTIPPVLLRPVYRLLIPPIRFLSARGSRHPRRPS